MTAMQKIITSTELVSILSNVTLVDVREPEEVAVSFISGAIFIPLGELVTRAHAELDPHADLVIYCAHGVRSLHGVAILNQLGFQKVRSLKGGLCEWEQYHAQ